MRSKLIATVGTLFVGTMLAGCATTSPGAAPTSASVEELGQKFGGCISGGESWLDAVDVFAGVDEWFEVDEIEGDRKVFDETNPITITSTSGRVAEARMFGATWPGVDWGIETGADVWIATATRPVDLVTVAMIVTPDGEVVFAGDCADEMRKGLYEHLGDKAPELLAQVPSTPPEEVYALLGYPDPTVTAPPIDEVVILNDESTDPSVLEGLHGIELTIAISDVVGAGEYTICTEITAGWNDCIMADANATKGVDFPVWVDNSGRLVFWLLDADADTAHPLGKLGEATATGKELSVLIDTSEISDDGELTAAELVTVQR